MTLVEEPQTQQQTSRARGLVFAVILLLAATTALTVYVVRLKRHAENMHGGNVDAQAVLPPVNGPKQDIVVVVADDSDGQLHARSMSAVMPAERTEKARQAVHVLLSLYQAPNSSHQIGKGSDVNSVFLVGDDLAVVDCNQAFAEGHRSGILVEELTIASIAKTLAANVPGVKRVKFLVEGKETESLAGHAELRKTYDVAGFDGLISADRASNVGTASSKKEVQ